jgi:O-antigen ligase
MLALASVVVVILIIVSVPRMKAKVASYLKTGGSSRSAMVRSAVEAVGDRTIFGYGPGMARKTINTYPYINEYFSKLHGRAVTRYLGLHNMILTIAVDIGVPGALGFLACMIGLIWCALRRVKFLLRDEDKLFLIAAIVGVVAWLLGGLTSAMISNNLGWILFGVLFYCVGFLDLQFCGESEYRCA